MFETTVKREELIKYVRKNMQEHQAIVEEALVGYKKSVIKILEERLEEARQGKNIVQALSFPQPRSHLRDYERVLKMLEMDNKEMITLDETQFAQYVQDDWGWKRAFLSEHAQYSSRAMQFMSGSQEDE